MPYFVGIGQIGECALEKLLALVPGQQALCLQRVGPRENGVFAGVVALDLVWGQHAVEPDSPEVHYLVSVLLLPKGVRVLCVSSLLSSSRHTLIIFM